MRRAQLVEVDPLVVSPVEEDPESVVLPDVVSVVVPVPVLVVVPVAKPVVGSVPAGVTSVTAERGTAVPATLRVGSPLALKATADTVPVTALPSTVALTCMPMSPSAWVASVAPCSDEIAPVIVWTACIWESSEVCCRIVLGSIGFVGSWFCSSATSSCKNSCGLESWSSSELDAAEELEESVESVLLVAAEPDVGSLAATD
jgi:hypothetical protein